MQWKMLQLISHFTIFFFIDIFNTKKSFVDNLIIRVLGVWATIWSNARFYVWFSLRVSKKNNKIFCNQQENKESMCKLNIEKCDPYLTAPTTVAATFGISAALIHKY